MLKEKRMRRRIAWGLVAVFLSSLWSLLLLESQSARDFTRCEWGGSLLLVLECSDDLPVLVAFVLEAWGTLPAVVLMPFASLLVALGAITVPIEVISGEVPALQLLAAPLFLVPLAVQISVLYLAGSYLLQLLTWEPFRK